MNADSMAPADLMMTAIASRPRKNATDRHAGDLEQRGDYSKSECADPPDLDFETEAGKSVRIGEFSGKPIGPLLVFDCPAMGMKF